MGRHGERPVYNIAGEELTNDTPGRRPAGCPVSGAGAAADKIKFRFGRLFDRYDGMAEALVELGATMKADPPVKTLPPSEEAPDDSNIPAGYTYLGQFIAHEITFDKTRLLDVPADPPEGYRSPSLDLDSLYGCGPSDEKDSEMYRDGGEFKLGPVVQASSFNAIDRWNDLPRKKKEPAEPGKPARYEAVIGDERNDENLPLAQTHLAFLKFHNRVVKYLRDNPGKQDAGKSLFEQARETVVRHFQHIVLHDFLPRVLDAGVLKAVLGGDRRCKALSDVGSKDELFMPVEFSGAAFRFGHSMVRPSYDYNHFQKGDPRFPTNSRPATLESFFTFTQFSGDLDGLQGLDNRWVIDWRRFYDFGPLSSVTFNKAKKIDTNFDLRLERIKGYPHNVSDDKYKAITARNLVRGYVLKLPTGQTVAKALGETPMTAGMITSMASDEQFAVLTDCAYKFHVRTPLWFYVLKEAELFGGGNRLGPVGSRVVAETFYCIIRHSDYSVITAPLSDAEMLPGREARKFDMADLLSCLGGDVNPTRSD
ncbi:MAG TPA: heme peroxidase family protein [Pyrinomonadaceae bacterium]|jgi:hypothetical protein